MNGRTWTGVFVLALLGLFARGASAQTAYVYLSADSALQTNEPYVRDDRTYARDAIEPSIMGLEKVLYKQTRDVNWYLFPLSVSKDEPAVLYISLPNAGEITTAYLNGEPLSATTPVVIDLTEASELHLATAKTRLLTRLCFTNLPILSFTYSGNLTRDDKEATLVFIDPDYEKNGMTAAKLTTDALISRRGNSSSNYGEKRPYNFSLIKDGEKWDTSLAGLRADSDWLLDAAFSDASRMRNRVCMDVWDDVYALPWNEALSGATDGCYAEVFVNGIYKGLFVLGEKQDRTQLGLKNAASGQQGTIFRTTDTYGAEGASPAGFYSIGDKSPGETDVMTWYNVEIKFPKEEYCSSDTWEDFYALAYLVVKGSDEAFKAQIGELVDLDNLADYYLFANALNLNDNMRKNMTFVAYDAADEDGDNLILLPWDMDASLGRAYSSLKTKSKVMTNKLFDRLLETNAGGFKMLLYERWQTLKTGALSLENVMGYFDGYYEIITRAGALSRETDAHPTFTSYLEGAYGFDLDIARDIAYIRTFLTGHLEWWDAQIEALAQ